MVGSAVALHKGTDKAPNTADLTGTDAQQYRSVLHRYLVRQLHNAEDAKDLAQEAYMRFFQLPHAGLVGCPSGYLFRIAMNLVYEFRLRRDRAPVIYDSPLADEHIIALEEDISTNPEERLSTEDQLRRVLGQIPPMYRKVLIMHKRDGLSYEEIAELLSLSKQSVQKYLARALAYGRLAKWD